MFDPINFIATDYLEVSIKNDVGQHLFYVPDVKVVIGFDMSSNYEIVSIDFEEYDSKKRIIKTTHCDQGDVFDLLCAAVLEQHEDAINSIVYEMEG